MHNLSTKVYFLTSFQLKQKIKTCFVTYFVKCIFKNFTSQVTIVYKIVYLIVTPFYDRILCKQIIIAILLTQLPKLINIFKRKLYNLYSILWKNYYI